MNARRPVLNDILCDRRSYILFRYAAWSMIPMAIVVLIALSPVYDSITSNVAARIAFQVVSGCVWAIGAVTGIVLFLGMLGYLLFLDQSSWKLLWLIVFLFISCCGSSIYFFKVYKKQGLPQLDLGSGQSG